MFSFFSHHGVLGLNARNLLYVKPFNPRKAVAFADDKLKTKAFLAARGIPVAKIYARIETREQLGTFDFSQLPDECVLKPNNGFGGEGILIFKGRKDGLFLEEGKQPISEKKLREHIEDILDGQYSVNGRRDAAFFERILIPDSCFAPFRPAGLPDIRIVVFNLVPVMAMLRIPTAGSHGKANVHQGGIGIGIDLSKGVTTYATQYNRIIDVLPHGGSPAGVQIPHFEELLLIASRIQSITNIGYLAVDLTIDAEQGPVLLEVNARAGLMVQVANLAPLRSRLERVAGVTVSTPEKGVRLAQDLFGEKVRQPAAPEDPERPVLATRETVSVSGAGTTVEIPALIAPDQERSTVASNLLSELQQVEGGYRIKFTLGGKKIQTVVREDQNMPSTVRMMIGRRDLAGFLIDPTKVVRASTTVSTVKDDLRAIDKLMTQLDEELLVLEHLKPENLSEERARAEADTRYNPVFRYGALPENIDEMEERLLSLLPDDTPIGVLLKKKRRELLLRISLLRARGDARRLTEASAALFGLPSSILITSAASLLKSRMACELPTPADEMLTAHRAAPLFTEVLERYGLHDWQVSIRENLVARIAVGGKHVYLRDNALFPPRYIPALIAHEIETHVLTAENGDQQPYTLLRRGCANYLDTQEGLAIENQNRFLSPHNEKRFDPARLILGTVYALEHSFADTRAYLQEELGHSAERALTKAIDIKRGLSDTSEAGAFTKGIVYFRGQRAIQEFLAQGGDLKRLYIGKIALEDLDVIEQIPGIKPPMLLPEFLRENGEGIEKKKRKQRK